MGQQKIVEKNISPRKKNSESRNRETGQGAEFALPLRRLTYVQAVQASVSARESNDRHHHRHRPLSRSISFLRTFSKSMSIRPSLYPRSRQLCARKRTASELGEYRGACVEQRAPWTDKVSTYIVG